MRDMELVQPKYEVEVRIKTHCTGCGLSHNISSISEPIVFQHLDMFQDQFDRQFRTLEQSKCPRCPTKKMRQVSIYDDRFP
jgi:hypothetical protein